MTLEAKIAELLAKAEPLRALSDLEQESQGLPGIVDMINALRAEQASGVQSTPVAPVAPVVEGADAEPVEAPPPVKRGPGRPKKADS